MIHKNAFNLYIEYDNIYRLSDEISLIDIYKIILYMKISDLRIFEIHNLNQWFLTGVREDISGGAEEASNYINYFCNI